MLLTEEYGSDGNRIPTKQGRAIIKTAAESLGINENICRLIDVGTCFSPYFLIQWEEAETVFQFNFETRRIRHRGTGSGCFWTEWEFID